MEVNEILFRKIIRLTFKGAPHNCENDSASCARAIWAPYMEAPQIAPPRAAPGRRFSTGGKHNPFRHRPAAQENVGRL